MMKLMMMTMMTTHRLNYWLRQGVSCRNSAIASSNTYSMTLIMLMIINYIQDDDTENGFKM